MKEWEAYLKKLTVKFGPEIVKRWLTPLTVQRFDAGNLYLQAQDTFQVLWFNEHIAPYLKREFLSQTGRPIKVHLTAKTTKKTTYTKPPSQVQTISFESIPPHPDMTFDTFLTESQHLASEILKTPEVQFNPVFLYGPAGSGKTHLLNATASCLPGALFVHAETFTEHVVAAMRTAQMDTFRAFYRRAKSLIIDDIHLIAKRSATQEELFHTFNALHTAGIQIVFSSNTPPAKLKNIEPRLISRFEWGIALSLEPPTAQLLEKIFYQRCQGLQLEPAAQNFLLHTFTDAKELFQALETLMLKAHMQKICAPLTTRQVQDFLHTLLLNKERKALTPPAILKAVAETFEISTDDLLGKSQTRECSIPRKIAMYFFRQKLKMPYTKIGEHFCRDHSTVITSCRDIIRDYTEHKNILETLENLLR